MPENTTDSSLVAIGLLVVAALVVLPILFMGFGMMGVGPTMGPWGHGMWGDGGMPGWMLLAGMAAQFLFLAAVLIGGYLLVRSLVGSNESSDRALEELRVAYARGKLSDEEYERRRETLERDR